MTVDCRWVESNLEALFAERLSEEESRRVRGHIETCVPCRREAQALDAIDPLIRRHFKRQMQVARRPRVVHKSRVFGLSGAAAAVVALLLVVLLQTPPAPVATPGAGPESGGIASSAPVTPKVKADDESEIKRLRPEPPAPAAPADRRPQAPLPVTSNSPEFLVADPAGYAHGVEEYRGRTVLIGVWEPNQNEAIANLERIYKANSANAQFRLLGVSREMRPKPANTTFPIFYNQGSKLFGATAGEFVLLDENGAVQRRGSLVKDFEDLSKALQVK
jgi:hypothetical protein